MTTLTRRRLPVLVLSGGPAVGKSSTALGLARSVERCAVIDVDDVRHLVVNGHTAPWDGADGHLQQLLGVRNACALAHNFTVSGISVIVADVVTPETADLYRELLDDVLVIHLTLSRDEARRRAATRPVYLTAEQFEHLHEAQESDVPEADFRIDVTELEPSQQAEVIQARWHPRPDSEPPGPRA